MLTALGNMWRKKRKVIHLSPELHAVLFCILIIASLRRNYKRKIYVGVHPSNS